jgi:hypothetical protein
VLPGGLVKGLDLGGNMAKHRRRARRTRIIAVAVATLLAASVAVSLGVRPAGASSGSNWPYVFPGNATSTPLTSDPAGGVAANGIGSFNVQLSPAGTVDWNDTAASPAYLDHLPVYDGAGNAYYTRCNVSCTVEKHGPTGQLIWPADGTSNLGALTGNPIALSPDGVVYAFTTDRRLVGLNAVTGASAFAPVTVNDYAVSDQKILYPYPGAVALVTASQIGYYTAQGNQVATYSLPSFPTATTSAGDGSVELAWGSCGTRSISIERVTPSGVQWSKTIPGPSCSGNGDPVALLGALPDGGVAVAANGDGTILPTVTVLNPGGSVRWANALPLASGTTAVELPDLHLAVDTSGNIVVGLNTTWQCQSGTDTCWAVQAFTYTAGGAPLIPPIDLQVPDPNPVSYGNPLSGMAIATGRIYLASSHFTGGQYSAGPTDYEINKVDTPGIGPMFPEGKNWPTKSLVALGDSVAAGEGINYGFVWKKNALGILTWVRTGPSNPSWMDTTLALGKNYQQCHQSSLSYPNLIAINGGNYNVYNMACTGATALQNNTFTKPEDGGVLDAERFDTKGQPYPQTGYTEGGDTQDPSKTVPAQLGGSCTGCASRNAYFGKHNPDVVLLTMGANDLNFAYWLYECYDPLLKRACNTTSNTNLLNSQLIKEKSDLATTLSQLNAWAAAKAKTLRVLVTNYYDPFNPNLTNCIDYNVPIGGIGITGSELAWLENGLINLNANIAADVKQAQVSDTHLNVSLVNMSNVMSGHQWCTPHPWVYGASIDFPVVGDSILPGHNQSPFHPTPEGQRAIYLAVKAHLP